MITLIKKIIHGVTTRLLSLLNKKISLLKTFLQKKQNSPTVLKEIQQYRKDIKIYDCFIFFNELDLLEMRLNILNDSVDYFVLVESTKTFTGTPKPLYYQENKSRFQKFEHKIIHIINEDTPDSLEELKGRRFSSSELDKKIIDDCCTTKNIPKNEAHWLREFYQKEQIKKGLLDCSDIDFCFISDIDEIWNPKKNIDHRHNGFFKFKQDVYVYYLNNRSSEEWYGSFAGKYKNIKNKSINHLDTPTLMSYTYIKNGGWHFTNQGGADAIKTKLESYGHQEFNNEKIKSQINQQIQDNKDFVGRKFTFWVDDSGLPEYIKNNKQKYQNFFK